MLITKAHFGFFRDAGNSLDMAVDGSITPVTYKWSYSDCAVLTRVLIHIANPGADPDTFMGLPELSSGLLVKVYDEEDAEQFDFLDGETIKTHSEFGLLAGPDTPVTNANGSNDDVLCVRWTLEKTGRPLHLPPGWCVGITVQDNLSSLSKFKAFGQGYDQDSPS